MKLIRLTTDDRGANFKNTFNEDIIIEPFSKIALHSLTTQVQTEQIVIDAQNNEVGFNIAGSQKQIFLKHGIYDKENIDIFFNDFTTKLNESLSYNESELSRQFFVSTSANKFTLQLKTGTRMDPIPNFNNADYKFLGKKNVKLNTPKSITRDGGVALSNDSFLYLNSPICKGCGSFRARIFSNTNIADGGFIIALLSEPVNENTETIDPSKIVFGVRFVDTTQPYKIYKNGEEKPSTVSPVVLTPDGIGPIGQNDYITLDSYRGEIRAVVANTAVLDPSRANGLIIDSIPYNHTDDLYPVIICVSANTTISDIICASDPFYNDSNNKNYVTEDYTFGAIPSMKINKTANTFLTFNDIDLAKIVGFTSNRIPINGTKQTDLDGSLEYQGTLQLSFRDVADSYLFELMNINIGSFDSLKKQHMNLLSVIPQFDEIKERLIYSPAYPIFLSLNNPYKINLREVRARLLKEDLTGVATIGYSQATILIDN